MDQSENHSKNDDMILKLRKITHVNPIIDPTVEIDHTVDEITASGKETKSVWEINNLETPLQCAKQTSSASKLESDIDLTTKMIRVGKIFWIDIDQLSFFSLTFLSDSRCQGGRARSNNDNYSECCAPPSGNI